MFMTDAPRSTVLLSLPDRGEAPEAPDALFASIVRDYGTQISRIAMGYERNVVKRHKLRQEMLLAVWQSLAVFRRQCSLRTWAYQLTHNMGVSHIQREKRRPRTVSLDDETLDVTPITAHADDSVGWRDAGRCDWLFGETTFQCGHTSVFARSRLMTK